MSERNPLIQAIKLTYFKDHWQTGIGVWDWVNANYDPMNPDPWRLVSHGAAGVTDEHEAQAREVLRRILKVGSMIDFTRMVSVQTLIDVARQLIADTGDTGMVGIGAVYARGQIDLIREVCGGSEELFDLIVREVLS